MNFGEALELLKKGQMVSRKGWNGHPEPYGRHAEWIFMQVPSEIDATRVPTMQSLPDSVKEFLQERFRHTGIFSQSIRYRDQIAWLDSHNVIHAYVPEINDILADDWFVYEFKSTPVT